ncbi:hypothetical protein HAX54_040501 [Datura stramonium]|uniref:Uncharacterized protein n=1 Tax=Datura stramonium TaxID=4076 RepID=A0ABS8SL78_DATST|nr:hypothetical protein [Datura stramonium]
MGQALIFAVKLIDSLGALLARAFYSFYLILSSLEVYWGFLKRLGLSIGEKALSFSFRGLGYSKALAVVIAWSLKFLISESCNMMTHSGTSSLGSGEGVGRRGFSLTDLFQSSCPSNSEVSLNQPAPNSPNPGEPISPPS